jgi:excisionase family DNA binding protein
MSARRSAHAPAPTTEAGADALRALAVGLVPYLRELLADEASAAKLVDVAAVVPLPRRTIYAACRRGDLVAVKRGRRWLAARTAVDAWLRLGGPRLVPLGSEDDDLEELRRSLLRPGRQSRAR